MQGLRTELEGKNANRLQRYVELGIEALTEALIERRVKRNEDLTRAISGWRSARRESEYLAPRRRRFLDEPHQPVIVAELCREVLILSLQAKRRAYGRLHKSPCIAVGVPIQ